MSNSTYDPVAFNAELQAKRKLLEEIIARGAPEEPQSLSESIQSFRQEHPILSGMIAGFLLIKAKRLLNR